MLKDGRIFAVKMGETKHVTRDAVIRLAYALKDTKLGFIFVEITLECMQMDSQWHAIDYPSACILH